MSKPSIAILPPTLFRASQRFITWRLQKKRGSRLPAKLWMLATAQAHQHGINKTARALKLDYYSLKKRVEASSEVLLESSKATPSFVEMPGWTPAGGECTIEFQDEKGAAVRIHLKGSTAFDIPACVVAFRAETINSKHSKKRGQA